MLLAHFISQLINKHSESNVRRTQPVTFASQVPAIYLHYHDLTPGNLTSGLHPARAAKALTELEQSIVLIDLT